MKSTTGQVGLFDAKTHLSKLVDRVGRGEEITITRRGAAVARLLPPEDRPRREPREAVARIRQLRTGLKLGAVKPGELINEGRL
jgi:prevent-host-death family protein